MSAIVRALVEDLRSRRSTDEEAIASAARVLDVSEAAIARALGRKTAPSAPKPERRPAPPATAWTRRPAPGRTVETCIRGHLLQGENVLARPNGSRTCRACHRQAVARHERKRARCRCCGTSWPCKAKGAQA